MTTKLLKYLYYILSALMVIMVAIAFYFDSFDLLMEYRALFMILFFGWWALLYYLFLRKRR